MLTATGREARESATENIPPEERLVSLPVRVKWCGKSAPQSWRQGWQGKPHLEKDQIGRVGDDPRHSPPGRSFEVGREADPKRNDRHPREGVQDPAYKASHVPFNLPPSS